MRGVIFFIWFAMFVIALTTLNENRFRGQIEDRRNETPSIRPTQTLNEIMKWQTQ